MKPKTPKQIKEMAKTLIKKGCTYREAEKLLSDAGYKISMSTIHRYVLGKK